MTPQEIIAFWHEAGPDRWFAADADFDRAIGERFGRIQWDASRGTLTEWEGVPDGALALLLAWAALVVCAKHEPAELDIEGAAV